MHIKRIEILGFKSFVDKAVLDLEVGVTGIVGPNGCGKSNIVDAIRWAMGEQNAKNLRGRGMEDVIFGGCESRKALSMAEVSLIFSNEEGRGPAAFRDYAEIMITRRLYRDGESDYLINKTPCRLLDITELFMDTGVGVRAYSIIEQGKIGMILSAKAADRRFLIEEAAGVTKFKSRKKTALRKIDATQQNLLRIGDIVSEVRRQLGGLKRQAQKAERFREYREELKGIEVRFARLRYDELLQELTLTQRSEVDQSRLLEGLVAEVASHETQMEEARLLQSAAEREVSQGQERLYHFSAEIQKVEDRHAFAGKEIDAQQLQAGRLTVEIDEVGQRLIECDGEETTLKGGGESLVQELATAERQQLEGQSALEELSLAAQDAATRMEEARTRLYALLTDLSRLGNLHEDAQRRLRAQEERFSRNRHEAVTVREQLEQAQQQCEALEKSLVEARVRRSELQAEQEETAEGVRTLKGRIDENEHRLLSAREELNRLRSRLESLQRLERDLEGYGGGVKTVLREESLAKRFSGMLADLLDAPADIEVALEAVLGERLQSLLAPTVGAARDALDFLRERGGRSTFVLPIGADPVLLPFNAGIALCELVRPRPEAAASVAQLLAGVYLVESLDPYLGDSILPFGITLATRRGETLNWRGELNGGSNVGLADGLLHKKREIRELDLAIAEKTQTATALQEEREELRRMLQQTELQLSELGTSLHHHELKVVNVEKDLSRLLHEVGRFGDRLEVLSLEEDQLHEERQGLEQQLNDAGSGRSVKEAEKTALEALTGELQEEVSVRRRDVDTVRERLTAVRVEVASLKEREEGSRRHVERLGRLRQELRGRQTLLRQRIEETEQERERLQVERQRMEVELELLIRRREEEKLRFDKLRAGFEERTRGIEGREEALKTVRNRMHQLREELGNRQLRLRELELEAEHLREAMLERFRFNLRDAGAPDDSPFDPETAANRQKQLRRAIEEIGEVNLMAIEEYRELDERYQFLTRQQDDLKQSLDGLQIAITKINRTTRKRFRETFELVNEKFQELFPRLFRGGRAELRLTDEEDLLESGIDIIVQPPGKKLQNITLLSGGEKALTAVALIFSIFLIKPSPFCLLDEVDAPLDEANIGRFNEMVREMSAISQFVIITHNKRTMEIVDTLYGVTMEEPGVSKLVSVRLNAG